jgi:hypothetical protein
MTDKRHNAILVRHGNTLVPFIEMSHSLHPCVNGKAQVQKGRKLTFGSQLSQEYKMLNANIILNKKMMNAATTDKSYYFYKNVVKRLEEEKYKLYLKLMQRPASPSDYRRL